MVWTAPMTAVSNAVFTADQWNQFVRANLNATAPGIATVAARLIVTAGANVIAERDISQVFNNAGQSTSSTSYTDLATAGPVATLVTGNRALVIITCQIANNTVGARSFVGFEISGATTLAPADNTSLEWMTDTANQEVRTSVYNMPTLTTGTNVFTMKYRVDAGTATFRRRRLQVIGF